MENIGNEEYIGTIAEDIIVIGVSSINGESGDLNLKTINGNDLLGEGDIEINTGVTTVNGESGDVVVSPESIGAATSEELGTEKSARELADQNLQTAINGKQAQLSSAQLDAVNSGINSSKVGQISSNANEISNIEGKIPEQASSSNQLADKNFVNSSVATNTANYISNNGEPFSSVEQLESYSGTLTNNDYAFVVGTDSAGNVTYTRYKYNATTQEWAEEYVLNNSSFTANQWSAINSGITSGDVSKLVDFGGTDGSVGGSTGLVPAPTISDANKYLNADGSWEAINGRFKELDSGDYNYPENDPNPTAIAPWLLNSGIYKVGVGVNVKWAYNQSETYNSGGFVIVEDPLDSSKPKNRAVLLVMNGTAYSITYINENGTASHKSITSDVKQILTTADVINNLTTPSYYQPLSAKQGNVLKERVNGISKNYNIVVNDWVALASSDPYDYQVTIASGYVNFGTNTIAELLNDNPVLFATHGFAIASMDSVNKTITLYSIGKPSNTVSLNVIYKEPA